MESTGFGPSERDISIYVAHKVEGFSLRRVATRHNLTAQRIFQICKAIEPWVVRQLVAEHPDRMTMKLRETARLETVREEAFKGWRRSLKDAEKQVAKIGGKFGDTMEHSREGQAGDAALLRIVLDCDKAIRELWALDEPPPGGGRATGGLHVNVNGSGDCKIVIVEDEHWYGNDAHSRAIAAEAVATPTPGAIVGGPIQSGGVRASVGQNGAGSNGAH